MHTDHRMYREMLSLSAYSELTDDEQHLLQKHLESCDACRKELEELRAMKRMVSAYRPMTVGEADLQEARIERRVMLRRRTTRRSVMEDAADFVNRLFAPPVRVALAGALLLAVGFLTGSLATRTPAGSAPETGMLQTVFPAATFEKNDMQILNFRFVDRNAQTGEVEFTFDAVTPLRMRGSLNDTRVQNLLARALVSDENPGARLRAVNMIAGNAERIQGRPAVTDEVKNALITALRYDKNLGVRKQALSALQYYLPDQEAARAILDVLTKEQNTGMRIAAVNALDLAKFSGQPAGREVVRVLKKAMQSDDNNYIRIRASAALKEIQQ